MSTHLNMTPAQRPGRSLKLLPLLISAALSGLMLPAHADDRSEVEQLRATQQELLKALMDAGLISREKADEILRKGQARAAAADAAPAAPVAPAPAAAEAPKAKVVRVPYVSEAVKAEMREQIRQDVLAQAHQERWGEPGALPGWLSSLSFEGDLRVRFQRDLFGASNNPPDDAQGGFAYQTSNGNVLAWAPDLTNTQTDRDRMTLRGRFGVRSRLSDEVSAGLRLSTGSASSPVGASQTLGTNFNKYGTYMDQAYLRYDRHGEVMAVAGRFGNPFYGTDLTWPDDLNFDGVAVSWRPALGAAQSLFMTAGAFPLQEFETSAHDKWLYGAQVGTSLNIAPSVQFRAGLALYDFQRIEGVSDTNAGSTSSSYYLRPNLSTEYPVGVRLKGNTLMRINNGPDDVSGSTPKASVWGLASKFRPLNFSTDVTFYQFFPTTVRVSLDVIRNLGFDVDDIRRRAGGVLDGYDIAKKTLAVQTKLTVGRDRIEHAGDWQSFLTFRRFERDAWVDAFTDTTWHLGGTNYQGWSIGGQYGVANRTSLGARWTSTRNLHDGTLYGSYPGYSDARLKIDVMQVELNTRF